MSKPDQPVPRLSLRDRKKEMTRQAIRESAERLFERRGYDQVSVAEIADAANISVKTLFTYIRSKEDLLFGDTSLIDAIVASLRARPLRTSAGQAVADALVASFPAKGSPVESLAMFRRGYGDSTALRGRLARLWIDYEDTIAAELATEQGSEHPDADTRFEAAQLVILVRATTWPEFLELAKDAKSDAPAAIETWLRKAAAKLGNRTQSA